MERRIMKWLFLVTLFTFIIDRWIVGSYINKEMDEEGHTWEEYADD